MSEHAVHHGHAPVGARAPRASARADAGHAEIGALSPHFEALRFPLKQIFGFIASLVLTVAALLAVTHHILPPAALLAVVLGLAVVQAALQLGLFMHVREGVGPTWQVPLLALAFLVAIGIVGFSIWIVTFKSGVS